MRATSMVGNSGIQKHCPRMKTSYEIMDNVEFTFFIVAVNRTMSGVVAPSFLALLV